MKGCGHSRRHLLPAWKQQSNSVNIKRGELLKARHLISKKRVYNNRQQRQMYGDVDIKASADILRRATSSSLVTRGRAEANGFIRNRARREK